MKKHNFKVGVGKATTVAKFGAVGGVLLSRATGTKTSLKLLFCQLCCLRCDCFLTLKGNSKYNQQDGNY